MPLPLPSSNSKMEALRTFISVATMAVLIELAIGASFNVGGPNGSWDQSTDLSTWASSHSFAKGDSLVFTYTSLHSVLEVSKADYDSCQTSSSINSSTSGSTTIALSSVGKRYFICGTSGHCSQGMKLEIDTVAAAVTPPPASPVTPPPASPVTPPPASSPPPKSPPSKSPSPKSPPPKSPSKSPTVAPSKAPSSSPSPTSPTIPPSSPTIPPSGSPPSVEPPSSPLSPTGPGSKPSAASGHGFHAKAAMSFGFGMLLLLAL